MTNGQTWHYVKSTKLGLVTCVFVLFYMGYTIISYLCIPFAYTDANKCYKKCGVNTHTH